ncbi:heme o synthase [Fimbriimonas ginsengisoli]|uniref:heme o synthase n=1 Tax=Fimbriimonas ginsengisoli TaxID=1005039 RepID=UPI0003E937F2
MNVSRFAKYAWLVLLYNLAAVAWGVYVRASKSGDGCGSHWPLCDGDSTPLMGPGAKLVEMSHRISTGLILPMALVMVVWAWIAYPKKHLVRKASGTVLGFVIMEALVGAALVKFGLVTTNDSAARAGVMAFHVVSTFLLLGAISLAALGASGLPTPRLKGQSTVGWIIGMACFGVITLGVSGAISALGHQLHETPNVLQAAMNPATHWMVRLQPLHPFIAASIGLYLMLAAGLLQHLRPDPRVKAATRWVVGLFLAQLALGSLNIWLKAPIEMQMAHLMLADVNWISLVALGAFCLADGIERVESRPAPEEAGEFEPLRGRELIKAYIALTKPRVISLLLFTTLTAMVAAKGQWPGTWLFLAVALGGYMSAGAANAINMVIDRDIDLAMKRTAKRPTVTQSIPSRDALLFAFALAASSFALLWFAGTLLSAVMAFSGLVFYVVVYTMLLKRRTWSNIVIGGAAGAFPPLVGWAAVTNDLPPLSLYLFAIIFVWTPVHFWALALLLKDDYAAAGVPMLPCVKGDRHTVIQIGIYGIITFIVSLLPFLLPKVGWIYAGAAFVLNAILLYLCVELYRRIDRPRASRLFHYSMLYLALLFLMFAIDRAVVMA